ncbi:MAG: hypothetical protein HY663_02040 [Chloroflexi bacterium]|nr:hypothetical protein [Chloroflexota bacterium]
MKPGKYLRLVSLPLLLGSLLVFASACQQATTENIQGLLQALEGKEMVVKLDDGTIARINVADSQSAQEAEKLIGKQVDVNVRLEKGERQLEKVEKRAKTEDQTVTGAIESINANMAKINGQNFKIAATTELDGGLVAGATARVEFIKLADGTLLATEIETDKKISKIRGTVDSIGGDKLVVGGQVFHMDDSTQRHGGLSSGEAVHLEFVDDKGVKHVTELEPQVENTLLTGTIQAMTANSITVDGRTFMINAATMLDSGLAVGALARLEFITMANGDLVATEIENDENEVEIEHGVELEMGDDRGANNDRGGGGGSSGK